MNTFIRKILLFSFVISTILITLMFYIEKTVQTNSTFRLNPKIHTIFIGHSHPQYAYNDSIIQNSVNLSYSMDSYFYTYIKLKYFIHYNKQLKNIYIEFSNNSIIELFDYAIYNNNNKPKMVKFMPYLNLQEHYLLLKNNPLRYITARIESASIYTNKILHNQLNMTHEFGRFEKYTKQLNKHLAKQTSEPKLKNQKTFCYLNLYYLLKIIDLANKNNLNISFIRSPTHPKWIGRENEFHYKRIKKIYFPNIKLIDMINFKLKNQEFGDLQHLNYKGATKYSLYLNKMLNN